MRKTTSETSVMIGMVANQREITSRCHTCDVGCEEGCRVGYGCAIIVRRGK